MTLIQVLADLQIHLLRHGLELTDFDLPMPDYSLIQDDDQPQDVREETSYDSSEQGEIRQTNVSRFNEGQKKAYAAVMNAVESGTGGLFSLNAPGGMHVVFSVSLTMATRSSRNLCL